MEVVPHSLERVNIHSLSRFHGLGTSGLYYAREIQMMPHSS